MELIEKAILLEASLEDVYNKYYSDIAREDFDRVIAIDPTFDKEKDKMGEFGKWLLVLFKKGEDLSDEKEFKDQLQIFKSIKNKLPADKRDINRVKSLHDLIELNASTDVASKSDLQVKAEQHPGANFICKSDNWEVYQPTNYQASKWLRGDDAVWCTGRHDDDYYWREYTSDGGKLFIFINTSGDTNEHNVKYQVAITKDNRVREFKDARNSSANFITFISDDGLYQALSQTDIALTAEYKAIKEFKETRGTITYSKLMAIKYSVSSTNNETELYKLFKEKVLVIIVNAGISYMPDCAFQDFTSLKKVVFPDSVRQLGRSLFLGCTSLKTVKIPPRITIIPVECFANCKNLETVYFGTNVVEIKNSAFYGVNEDVKLITPKHRITIPKKDKDWYVAHIDRPAVAEESLDEALSDKFPDWMVPFINNSSMHWDGYNNHSGFKNHLLEYGLDLANVKFKKAKTPKTRDEVKELLNDTDNKLYFCYVPKNPELFYELNDSRNWSSSSFSDIIYTPGETSCSIGYYAPDRLDKLSATKLAKLLSTGKVVYVDKNDPSNFRKEKQAARRDARGDETNGRVREYGQRMMQNYIVRKKDDEGLPPRVQGDRYDWPAQNTFDNRKDAYRWYNGTGSYWPDTGGERVYVKRSEFYYPPEPYGTPVVKSPKKSWGSDTPDYDLSGYPVKEIRKQLKTRLNNYRKGNPTQLLDRLQSQMEAIKPQISSLFTSAIGDGSSTAMFEFQRLFSTFTDVVKDYNELISNLDFILMVEDETERNNLLDKLFSLDRWNRGKFSRTIHEVAEEIKNLEKQLKEFETDFVESLKK